MSDVMTLFQRTASGLAEIQNKTHELTQSERLVLIMADGVTSCDDLRVKLRGLAEERFERALQTLLEKGLIAERDFSGGGVCAEPLDSGMVDLFLRQDSLDPVTIATRNLSGDTLVGELESNMGGRRIARPPGMMKVDFYLPLEPLPKVVKVQSEQDRLASLVLGQRNDELPRQCLVRKSIPQWGCWMLLVGVIVVMLLVLVNG